MNPLFVLVGVAIAAYIAVGLVAARKVAAGRGRWVWVQRSFQLVIPVFLIYQGLLGLKSVPVVGLLMIALGVGLLAVAVRMLRRMSRGVSAAKSPDEISAALIEPLADQYVVLIGVTLVAGLVAVVALIVYGVMLAAR